MKIYCDECLNVLRTMEDNSIDAVVTDPPYGLKFMNKKWDYDVPTVDTWRELLRVMKPGSTLLCFAGSRTQHRMAVNIEDAGFIIKDTIMWLYGSGFPKAADISKQLDKIAGKEREVIGIKKGKSGENLNKLSRLNGNDSDNAKGCGAYGHGAKQITIDIPITTPATEEAKKWDGWKSHGLKPAYEPIIMAMKSNEGSYSENALKWNVSGINIDACRLGGDWYRSTTHMQDIRGGNFNRREDVNKVINCPPSKSHKYGRFPANVIFSHHIECEENKCHEDCPVKQLDEQSGNRKGGSGNGNAIIGESGKNIPLRRGTLIPRFDEGGASRFFYCAKAYKTEKNIGVDFNDHPTVKPIKVMEYLCKMISMPDKTIVLDPFMGSGTTGIACINLGLDFVGIEREKKYFKIAEYRLNHIEEEIIETPKKIEKAVNVFF
jgi:DNA modification methylase